LTKKPLEELGEKDHQIETLKRAAKEIISLPNEEYVDFLRDLRDILNLHKEYFLTKMTIFNLINFHKNENKNVKLNTNIL
jgi:hypothetical protein